MKPWTGWAIVKPSGEIATIDGEPMIYRLKRDAMEDKEDEDSVCRVLAHIVLAGRKGA